MTGAEILREELLDELREVWLSEWRSQWEADHPDEMDEAIDGDSSFGGHPYWAEPTTAQLDAYADAALRAIHRVGVDERMEALGMVQVLGDSFRGRAIWAEA